MLEPMATGVLRRPKWYYSWRNWLVRYSKRYSRVSGTHVVLSVIDGS